MSAPLEKELENITVLVSAISNCCRCISSETNLQDVNISLLLLIHLYVIVGARYKNP